MSAIALETLVKCFLAGVGSQWGPWSAHSIYPTAGKPAQEAVAVPEPAAPAVPAGQGKKARKKEVRLACRLC